MIRPVRLAGGVAAIALLLALAPAAEAAGCDTSWSLPVTGSWADPARWSNGVPSTAKRACITTRGTYGVVVDGPASAGGLTLGGASGTQTLRVVGGGAGQETTLTLADQATETEEVLTNGVLSLESADASYYSQVIVENGTLVNTGTIRTLPAGNTGRFLNGNLVTTGTLDLQGGFDSRRDLTLNGNATVPAGVTWRHSPLSGTFVWQGGSITNMGRIHIAGGGFTALAGTLSGNAIELRDLDYLRPSGTGSAAFKLLGLNSLASDIGAGYSIALTGGAEYGWAILNLYSSRANAGTISLLSTDGSVTVDASSALTATGDYTQGSGSTRIDGTLTASGAQVQISYDRLGAPGPATLAGTLDVTTAEFSPTPGQSFVILSARSVNGTFASVHFSGPAYEVRYNPSNVTLRFEGRRPCA
jgi:hypothetical protein